MILMEFIGSGKGRQVDDGISGKKWINGSGKKII